MQIENLKSFCDLADTQSFTKAAEMNGVTQSAMSQQVTALELAFKSALIARGRKQFRLTPEGEALYDYGQQIVQIYQSLHGRMEKLKDASSGAFCVAAVYSIGLHKLPRCIREFSGKNPGVIVQAKYGNTRQVYEDVLNNAADLGLVANPRKDKVLETVPLGSEPLVLICHPEHPFAKKKSVPLRALKGYKLISFETDGPMRRALGRVLKPRHVEFNQLMELDTVESVKRAVEIDAGISIVPQTTITDEVAKRRLVAVEIQDVRLTRPLAAISKRSRPAPPTIKEFLAILKTTA